MLQYVEIKRYVQDEKMEKMIAQTAWVCLLVNLAVIGFASPAASLDSSMQQLPTDQELLILPSYCQVKMKYFQKPKGAEYKKLESLFGKEDFQHLHHYCWGLNWMNRYGEKSQDYEKRHCLKSALAELDYTTDKSTRGFFLLPEVHLNKSLVLRAMGKISDAVKSATTSISLNRRYVKAYLSLSELLAASGKNSDAIKILELGLLENPGDELLEKQLNAFHIENN